MVLLVRQYVIKRISMAGKIVFLFGIVGGVILGFITGKVIKRSLDTNLFKFNWGTFVAVFSICFVLSMLLLAASYVLDLMKKTKIKPSAKKSKKLIERKHKEAENDKKSDEWNTIEDN